MPFYTGVWHDTHTEITFGTLNYVSNFTKSPFCMENREINCILWAPKVHYKIRVVAYPKPGEPIYLLFL